MILACLAGPSWADEQEKPKIKGGKGFYLGLRFIGSSLHVDETGDDVFFVKDDGGGAELLFGYGFNDVFSLELSLGGANHDTSDPRISADFGFFNIFAQYRFAPGRSFRPYIKGGLGGYVLDLKEDTISASVSGGGLAFGGGFDYFFTRHFSIGADFTHKIINYDQAELRLGDSTFGTAIDEEGAQSSLGLAFAYHF
jgi:opacity protein-like surface antigen